MSIFMIPSRMPQVEIIYLNKYKERGLKKFLLHDKSFYVLYNYNTYT